MCYFSCKLISTLRKQIHILMENTLKVKRLCWFKTKLYKPDTGLFQNKFRSFFLTNGLMIVFENDPVKNNGS